MNEINSMTMAENESQNTMVDQMILKYLETKGYLNAATKLHEEIQTKQKQPHQAIGSKGAVGGGGSTLWAGGSTGADTSSLENFAKSIALKTETSTANHILFYGLNASDPTKFHDAYIKLTEWIYNSLDMYKYELYAILYPVFVHSYLQLITTNNSKEAVQFFESHSKDHTRLHAVDIRQLSLVLKAENLDKSEFVQHVMRNKFVINLSLLTFELLMNFLSDNNLFSLLCIINEHISIQVTKNRPPLQVQEVNEGEILKERESIGQNSSRCSSKDHKGVKSSKDVLSDASALNPSESEMGLQITSSDKELEFMLRSAGASGNSIDDLNKVAIPWGVLPSRHPIPDKSSADSTKRESSETPSEVVKDTTAVKLDTSSSPTKSSAKKLKRSLDVEDGFRLDSMDTSTTSLVSNKGPIPNQTQPYNAEILEKLLIRQSTQSKMNELEDLRKRVVLNQSSLPSALCFTFLNCHRGLNAIEFTKDVSAVAACFQDSSLRIWRNDNNPVGSAEDLSNSGNASLGSQNNSKTLKDSDRHCILRGHSGPVYSCSFSPDNQFVLSSSADSTVRLWNLSTRSNVVSYRAHHYPVWKTKFSPVGYYFATCSMDRTARLWSTDRIHPLRVFVGHLSDVDTLEFHPNCNYLATGSSDKTVRLWDVQSGRCVRVLTGHYSPIHALAFSPNGRLLATAGIDKYINIWDIASGKRLDSLVGHESRIHSLDFSKDGNLLASGGMDQTVRLWNALDFGKSGDERAKSSSPSTAAPHIKVLSSDTNVSAPPSTSLRKTLKSRSTAILKVNFTPRNLLLVGGCYQKNKNMVN